MLFAQQPVETPEPWRDGLALWSDILGIAGFVFSMITIAVAVVIDRRIASAKEEAKVAVTAAKQEAREAVDTALKEAKRFVTELARSQATRDLSSARLSMELAREACRSKQWVRAAGHLDASGALLVRLISIDSVEVAWRDSMREALDGARALARAIRSRNTKSGPLSDDQLDSVDDTISRIQTVEARFGEIFQEPSS